MISPYDTHITYFGNHGIPAVTESILALNNAGFEVVAGRTGVDERDAFRDAGIPLIEDRAEAVAGSQVVISCYRTSAEVEDLFLGDYGLLELMEPGSHAIDLSFSYPNLAREMSAMAAVSDIEILDAPLMHLGEKEEPCLFVGGNPKAIEDMAPLFPVFAPRVLPQKAPGEGQIAAAISLIAMAGSMMGDIEAMSLARVAGFDHNQAVSVLASTAGGSRALIDYVPRMLKYDYTGNIPVRHFLDYLAVALDIADQLDVTIPLMETAYQLYELLCVVGGEELNIQSIALLYEDEKTCADHGLDWALADGIAQNGFGPSLGAGLGYGTPYDADFDDLGMGPESENNPFNNGRGDDGIPPIDGFFSKN